MKIEGGTKGIVSPPQFSKGGHVPLSPPLVRPLSMQQKGFIVAGLAEKALAYDAKKRSFNSTEQQVNVEF